MSQVIQDLKAFFEAVDHPLTEVLDAQCCREGWLHGEMYRWFRRLPQYSSFRVNALSIGPRQHADFDSMHPIPLVGEVKILGRDYLTKCITGGPLKPVLTKIGQPIMQSDRQLCLGSWGLIPDYFRLVDFAAKHGRSAYLVLVADGVTSVETSMAKALREINFGGVSIDIPIQRGMVRLWKVHDPDQL
jgi:hypothetical protein